MSKAWLKNLYKFLFPFFLLAGLIALWLDIGGFPIVLYHSANTVFPAIHANETVTNPLKDIDVTDSPFVFHYAHVSHSKNEYLCGWNYLFEKTNEPHQNIPQQCAERVCNRTQTDSGLYPSGCIVFDVL